MLWERIQTPPGHRWNGGRQWFHPVTELQGAKTEVAAQGTPEHAAGPRCVGAAVVAQKRGDVSGLEPVDANWAVAKTIQQELPDPHPA
jgi:hypothetical protein